MVAWLQKIADAQWFQRLTLGVILLASGLVGLETYPAVVARQGRLLHALDEAVLWYFVAELVIKLGGRGARWWEFFRDPWNVFDFLVVAACLAPFGSQVVAVLRLVRVLRVLRLVTALPRLQILVGALLKSIPSMGYVGLLLLLHFYIYAVIGTTLFARNDPIHFGSLGRALLTLFEVVTLEGWVDRLKTQMLGSAVYGYEGLAHLTAGSRAQPAAAVAYFVSFILLGTMIILNLLIGVIMNGMQEAEAEAENAERARHVRETGQPRLLDDLNAADQQLRQLREQLERIRARVRRGDDGAG